LDDDDLQILKDWITAGGSIADVAEASNAAKSAADLVKAEERPIKPAEREYWDSVAVITKWDGGKFVEAELHPITLGFQTPRSERGRPKLASGADATRILDMMIARSKAFGATVTVKNGVGIVAP
jgi:poly-gamma-glutamate capsule biosynthesis protein CapA/YwtB (metallophosphatase superfamily)